MLPASTFTLPLVKQEQQSHQSHQFKANSQVYINQVAPSALLLSHPPREAAELFAAVIPA